MHKKTFTVFLRSSFFLLCLLIFTPLFTTVALLSWLVPDKLAYRWITFWSTTVIFLAKTICGIRYNVIGLRSLPQEACIVLCNHQSAWETLFLQEILPQQTWVLKRELLWIPFFGWALKRLKPIAIQRNRSKSILELQKEGKKALQERKWVIIFPEGTRVKIGEKKRYSRSGAILSQETAAPILPIAHNAGLFWPKNSFFKYPGIIQVVIGPLFLPQHYPSSQALNQAVAEWIESTATRLN